MMRGRCFDDIIVRVGHKRSSYVKKNGTFVKPTYIKPIFSESKWIPAAKRSSVKRSSVKRSLVKRLLSPKKSPKKYGECVANKMVQCRYSPNQTIIERRFALRKSLKYFKKEDVIEKLKSLGKLSRDDRTVRILNKDASWLERV